MHGTLQKFNPVVKKIWLQTLAGIVWTAVGILLSSYALIWLKLADNRFRGAIFTAGLILAAAVYYWGFSKLAKNNIHRIEAYINEKVCLFAFQKWSSYPLVLFMISLGIYLRKYSPFPKQLLAVIYLGIGGGLFLSSLHYHNHIYKWVSAQMSHLNKSK
jgi:hypothetical protein